MKHLILIGLAATAFLAGCSGADSPEPSRTTESHLDAACITQIKAPVGSAEWRAEIDACIATATGGYTPPTIPPAVPPPPAATGSGQSCSQSISCFNGTCRCSAGPNVGAPCDGAVWTGPGSCSILCQTCQ